MKKLGMLVIAALIGTTAGVYAAGLAIPEQGAAAMGMAASMTARQDLSSIFYNPAGLDYIEKSELLLGITPIRPAHEFEGEKTSADANGKTFFPPQAYIAHRFNSRLVMGAGLYAPFGLGTDWDPSWTGRYTSTYGEVSAVFFNPTATVQVTKWLSVGAGFSWVYSQATIEKMLDSGLQMYALTKDPKTIANSVNDSKFALDGEGGGHNWDVGMLLKPSARFQLGLAYRSGTDVDYTGKVKFTHPSHLASALSAAMPSSQDGETTLHLPASFNVGALYRFTEAWDASLDLNFVRWSTYDKLVIDLADNLPVDKLTQEKNWENTTVVRLGTSYRLNELTMLRGGFLYDKTPVPDETIDAQLPDNDRLGFSVGFGRTVGRFNLDFSYLFLKFMDRDKDNYVGYTDVTNEFPPTAKSKKDGVVNAADKSMLEFMRGTTYPVGNGTYKSHANLLSVSASIKF